MKERVKFLKTRPEDFLKRVQGETDLSFSELAKICKVHKRSFSDWKHERYLMPFHVFKRLLEISKLNVPKIKVVSEYWYTKKGGERGGRAVYKKYGQIPGWTVKASRRGGLKAAETHRKKNSSFFVLKLISFPKESSNLAEFFGIVLGDGGITDKQVIISLDREKGERYSFFVQNLAKRLFNTQVVVYYYRTSAKKNVITVTISSKNLVNFLISKELKKGNKVRQQVKVPSWIRNNNEFSKSCLRGLVDTDGGIYYHNHASHGCKLLISA